MPPTVKDDDARPSAPPLNDVENNVSSIPVVQAMPGPSSAHVAIPAFVCPSSSRPLSAVKS